VRLIAVLQGVYFVLTGIWPLISIDTFQKVTGPKSDLWLVKTVGSLIAVLGFVILLAGFRGNVTFEIFLLAVGSCAALAAVDINYSRRGVISRTYLLDAALETVLIILWIADLASGV
jgi:hypothetical protein